MSDPLWICVNLLPIGTYFCILALVQATRRPLVTTGRRNFLALAVALSGLVISGPIDLALHSRLLPLTVVSTPWAGVVLYIVFVAALFPGSYRSLVIYNASQEAVAGAVGKVLDRRGWKYKEVPSGWILPDRGVHLEIDEFSALANVMLHFRSLSDRELYLEIQGGLMELLSETRARWSLPGLVLGVAGGVVLAFPVWIVASDSHDLASLVQQVIETW